MKNSRLMSSAFMQMALMCSLNASAQAHYAPALLVNAFKKGYSQTKSPVTKPKTGKARAKMAKASRRQQRMKK